MTSPWSLDSLGLGDRGRGNPVSLRSSSKRWLGLFHPGVSSACNLSIWLFFVGSAKLNGGLSLLLFWVLLHDSRNLFFLHLTSQENWQRPDGMPATREHLMMVLADLDDILIRASYYTDMRSTSISDVSMEVAVPNYTGLTQALEVEECRCPPGYQGLSCQVRCLLVTLLTSELWMLYRFIYWLSVQNFRDLTNQNPGQCMTQWVSMLCIWLEGCRFKSQRQQSDLTVESLSKALNP